MASFYIFADFFNVWLTRRQLESHICSHSLLRNVVLVEVVEENLVLPRYVVGKSRNLLMAFLQNSGYSLILHQKLTLLVL